MVREKSLSFWRYLYLNTYAFLLAFWGIGILVIPLRSLGWIVITMQVLVALVFFKYAIKLFGSWDSKKRKYLLLMEKNAEELRPDTFTEFMQAPCGRLLTKVVLKDLNKKECYTQLKRLQKPFFVALREGCTPQKTTIYINPNPKK